MKLSAENTQSEKKKTFHKFAARIVRATLLLFLPLVQPRKTKEVCNADKQQRLGE
jgi:hypothetical protein